MKIRTLLFTCMCLAGSLLQAQNPGSLDQSFATVGFRVDPTPDTVGSCLVQVMQDGRIVSAGVSENGPDRRMHIFRYLANGDLDTTFAHTGEMHTPGPIVQSDYPHMVVQPDGKILVFYQAPATLDGVNAVGRFNVDGSLDATFGVGGWVMDSSDYPIGSADAIALQPDGKILIAGAYQDDFTSYYGLYAQRLLPNGALDLGYGSAGTGQVLSTAFGLEGNAAILQSDGKFLILGQTYDTITIGNYNTMLARLNANGTVDATFGTNGLVWDTQVPISQFTYDLALGLQGEIFVLGENPNPGNYADFNLAQFTSTGQLNTSFGTGGWLEVIDPAFDLYAQAIEVQPDGSILIACIGSDINFGPEVPNLVHLLPNYQRDPAFGINGIARPALNAEGLSPDAMALQPDGKIVIAGTSDVNWREERMTMARYHGALAAATAPSLAAIAELYPNPNAGLAQLRLMLSATAEVSVTVCDMLGRRVAQPVQAQTLGEGLYAWPVDATHLPAGTYLVQVKSGEGMQTLRMVVAH